MAMSLRLRREAFSSATAGSSTTRQPKRCSGGAGRPKRGSFAFSPQGAAPGGDGRPLLDRAFLSRLSGGARRRASPVVLLPPRAAEAIRTAWGKAIGRESASGAGDGCRTARGAAGPRPQTRPCHTWISRRAAGRHRDSRGWQGLHDCAGPRVPLERARLSGRATNP